MTPIGTNAKTLASYETHVADYIDGTSQVVDGAHKAWIDAALADLPPDAKVLELGSAFGRDAAYMASKGYSVECTDAAENFVSYLRGKGFPARRFNAITDQLDGEYDLILASAVMLHFTRPELALVLRKLCQSLAPQGRLAISLKRGEGEAWSTEKLDAGCRVRTDPGRLAVCCRDQTLILATRQARQRFSDASGRYSGSRGACRRINPSSQRSQSAAPIPGSGDVISLGKIRRYIASASWL